MRRVSNSANSRSGNSPGKDIVGESSAQNARSEDEQSASETALTDSNVADNTTSITVSPVESSSLPSNPPTASNDVFSASKDGSLLRLFQSELFDIYFHMFYLYNRVEPGIQDYLVNLLYRRSEEEIHFYLPQLCCLCLTRYKTGTLYRFILEKASKSMNLALKTSWLFHAAAEDSNDKLRHLALQLNQDVEMAIVNSKPVPPGSSVYTPSLNVHVPDLFKRRRAVHKLRTTGLVDPSLKVASTSLKAQTSASFSTLPHDEEEERFSSPAIVPAETASEYSSQPENLHLLPVMPGSAADLSDFQAKPETSTVEERLESTTYCRQPPAKQRIAPGFVKRVGIVTVPGARVKLPSVYSKLGSPFAYASFRDAALMDAEMQQYIIKQRRCDYYNLVNAFVSTLIEVSNRLAQEPDRVLRLPLLQSFLVALNEWMFCRRCIVAASEGTFTMTGLNIPLLEYGSLSSSSDAAANNGAHSTQVVRFIPDECRVLSSKKRAPFLLVFEVADLDEDLYRLPSIFRLTTSEFSRAVYTPPPNSRAASELLKGLSHWALLWNHLYVYGCILLELKERNLYTPPLPTDGQDDLQNTELHESPLAALRRCMGLIVSAAPATDAPTPALSIVPDGIAQLTHEIAVGDTQLGNFVYLNFGLGSESLPEPEAPTVSEQNEAALHETEQLMLAKEGCDRREAASGMRPRLSSHFTLPLVPFPQNQSSVSTSRSETGLDYSSHDTEVHTPTNNRFPSGPETAPSEPLTPRSFAESAPPESPSGEPRRAAAASQNRSSAPNDAHHLLISLNKPDSGLLCTKACDSPDSSIVSDAAPPKRSYSTHTLNNELQQEAAAEPKREPTASELAARAASVRRRLWGALWCERKEKYRRLSPYGHLASWNLGCVLVKGGDDVRQEMLASQVIRQFKWIFDQARLPLYLRPYEILVTGANSGIMVFVPDTISIDALKKTFGVDSIAKAFEAAFADNPYQAKKNFIESHAAYSLVAYLFQVKDRHNGNYLLDAEGHVIHIDYGYMLSNSPGNVNFESSPFKLTTEFLDIMDGELSENYEYFRTLIVRGFLEIRKHADRLLLLVELMLSASKMPCFAAGPEATLAALKERFMLNLTEEICIQKVVDLIDTSVNNWRTIQYDTFQRITNGIF